MVRAGRRGGRHQGLPPQTASSHDWDPAQGRALTTWNTGSEVRGALRVECASGWGRWGSRVGTQIYPCLYLVSTEIQNQLPRLLEPGSRARKSDLEGNRSDEARPTPGDQEERSPLRSSQGWASPSRQLGTPILVALASPASCPEPVPAQDLYRPHFWVYRGQGPHVHPGRTYGCSGVWKYLASQQTGPERGQLLCKR